MFDAVKCLDKIKHIFFTFGNSVFHSYILFNEERGKTHPGDSCPIGGSVLPLAWTILYLINNNILWCC